MGLIRFLLFLLAAYLLYRIVASLFRKSGHERKSGIGNTSDSGDKLVEDPQCGVYISRETAVRRTLAGRETFFCSNDCADRYIENKSR